MTLSISRPVLERSDRPRALTTPARHRVLEAVRVADGDHELADAERLRVAEREPPAGPRASMREDREVGVRVVADERRPGSSRPSGSVTSIVGRAVDDVAVGEDEAVGREDEPRPAAGLGARAFLAARGADVDVDDRRRDAIDGMDDRARVGVEKLVVRGLKSAGGESHGSYPIGHAEVGVGFRVHGVQRSGVAVRGVGQVLAL